MLKPNEIEIKSFEIIESMLGDKKLDPLTEHIVKRCIHTSADFDYADNLYFSSNFYEKIVHAFRNGFSIVTDTTMALAGINKNACDKFGINVFCFVADKEVIETSNKTGMTRSAISVHKAMELNKPIVYIVGNAPTALLEICKLYKEGRFKPVAVVGVPVGFVNVIESKEQLIDTDIPCVVSKGRKGGSNIAAAICNAILYKLGEI